MKHLRIVALLGAVTFLGTTAGAWAQGADLPASAKSEVASPAPRFIEIKNLSSAVVAYWLDPKHNPAPKVLGESKAIGLGQLPKALAKGVFVLPGGIKQIVSLSPYHNAVIIEGGNDEDIRQLVELINVLDQPLRQIGIETQGVELSVEDAGVFIDPWLGFDDAKREAGPLAPKVAPVKNNYMARLNALIADNRAKIVGAPRAIVANNFSSQLILVAPLTSPANGDKPETDSKINTTSGLFLEVVPTINGDDKISLQMELFKNPQGKQKPPEKIGVTAIVNLSDGDTIALSDLHSSDILGARQNYSVPIYGNIAELGSLFRSKPRETLVFVTARILRDAAK